MAHDVRAYVARLWTLFLAYARAGIRTLSTAPAEADTDTPTQDVVEVPLDRMVAYRGRAIETTLARTPQSQLAFMQQQERTALDDKTREAPHAEPSPGVAPKIIPFFVGFNKVLFASEESSASYQDSIMSGLHHIGLFWV